MCRISCCLGLMLCIVLSGCGHEPTPEELYAEMFGAAPPKDVSDIHALNQNPWRDRTVWLRLSTTDPKLAEKLAGSLSMPKSVEPMLALITKTPEWWWWNTEGKTSEASEAYELLTRLMISKGVDQYQLETTKHTELTLWYFKDSGRIYVLKSDS